MRIIVYALFFAQSKGELWHRKKNSIREMGNRTVKMLFNDTTWESDSPYHQRLQEYSC